MSASNIFATKILISCDNPAPTISPVAKEIIPIAKVSIKRIKDIFLFPIPSVKYIPNSLFLLFIKNLEA